MRKLLIAVAALAGVYVLLVFGSGLYIQSMLSGDSSRLSDELGRRFGVEVELGGGEFDLKKWFLFRPSVVIRDLGIGNPEGFSDSRMIEADEISAEVELSGLLDNEVRINRVVIREPELRIETGPDGRNNLASIAPVSPEPSGEPSGVPSEPAGEAGAMELLVEELSIVDGRLSLADLESGGELELTGVDIDVKGFSTGRQFDLALSAHLLGSESSVVSFVGRAGPFLQASFPAEGDISLAVAPAELPLEYRVKHFGNGLRDPGPESLARIDAAVAGDLMGTLKGEGHVSFDGFEFGRDSEHRLPLTGDAGLELTVENALNSPVVDIYAPRAELGLGPGGLNGFVNLAVGLGSTHGRVQGAIAGVDIDQMLGTFTTFSGQIYGTAAIPNFRLAFRGSGSEELLNSLAGDASITLEEGRITFMDTVDSVIKGAEAVLRVSGVAAPEPEAEGHAGQTSAAPEGETAFTTMSSNVAVADRQVRLTDIVLNSPTGDVTGSGTITFDSQLDFDLAAHLSGDIASALGGKPDENGVLRASVPFSVTGDFEDVRIRPDLSHLAVGAAARVIERLLSGGEEDGGKASDSGEGSIFDIFRKKE